MDIHISPDAARDLEALLAEGTYRTPGECVEHLLRLQSRRLSANAGERLAWMKAQESTITQAWDNDADAIYDRL